MYNLNKKEKLDFILQKVKELGISAYEISKKTSLTEAGIRRILNSNAKNPHENSLNSILLYLEEKTLGYNLNDVGLQTLNEPKEEYIKIPTITELQQEIILLYKEIRELRIENEKLKKELEKK